MSSFNVDTVGGVRRFNAFIAANTNRFSRSTRSTQSSLQGILSTASQLYRVSKAQFVRASSSDHSSISTTEHPSKDRENASQSMLTDNARKKLKRKHRKKRAKKSKKSTKSNLAITASDLQPTLTSITANELSLAQDLGILGSQVDDFVGSSNPVDHYRFALDTPSIYQLVLSGLNSTTSLQVLDSKGNLIQAAEGTPASSGLISGALAAGTYYVRVASTADTNYSLFTNSRTARETARSAYSFIDSMGVVTHLRYLDTSYVNYDGIIKPRLQELGIRHIRDGGSDAGFFYRVNDLANSGIRSTLVIDPRDGYTPDNVVQIIQGAMPAIEALEGPNEWDVNPALTYQEQSFPNNVSQFQRELYQAIKSNPTTAAIPIIAPSMAIPSNGANLGSLSSVVDLGNMHSYAGGNQPNADLDWKWIPQTQIVSGTDKSIVATETGWHNAIDDLSSSQRGVSEAVSGKYIPRTYLEYFNRGVKRTFMYELINQRQAGDQENNFGLLRADGSPKPAFIATRNLISLLNDSAETTNLGTLDYYLTGNTKNVSHTLLQKSNGDFYLIMWLEKPSTEVDISQNVTLNLLSPIDQATTYLPNHSTTPTAQYAAPTQLSFEVPDYPLVVQLHPSR